MAYRSLWAAPSPIRRGASSALASTGAGASVTIPVGAAARYVIFAHALLESRVREGESIGHVVANYLFRFNDGQVEHVPIRERFEVALVPTWWGGLPFLALPDDKNGLMPRYEGKWAEMGAASIGDVPGLASQLLPVGLGESRPQPGD